MITPFWLILTWWVKKQKWMFCQMVKQRLFQVSWNISNVPVFIQAIRCQSTHHNICHKKSKMKWRKQPLTWQKRWGQLGWWTYSLWFMKTRLTWLKWTHELHVRCHSFQRWPISHWHNWLPAWCWVKSWQIWALKRVWYQLMIWSMWKHQSSHLRSYQTLIHYLGQKWSQLVKSWDQTQPCQKLCTKPLWPQTLKYHNMVMSSLQLLMTIRKKH